MKKMSRMFTHSLFILALTVFFASCAFAAMSNIDFIRLCERGTLQEVEDAVKGARTSTQEIKMT